MLDEFAKIIDFLIIICIVAAQILLGVRLPRVMRSSKEKYLSGDIAEKEYKSNLKAITKQLYILIIISVIVVATAIMVKVAQ